MNVSNDFCPFLCWSIYWCFVVKVSIPQESKYTTHITDFYSLPCTWYPKNVSLINLIFILIVKTRKLSDGFWVNRINMVVITTAKTVIDKRLFIVSDENISVKVLH